MSSTPHTPMPLFTQSFYAYLFPVLCLYLISSSLSYIATIIHIYYLIHHINTSYTHILYTVHYTSYITYQYIIYHISSILHHISIFHVSYAITYSIHYYLLTSYNIVFITTYIYYIVFNTMYIVLI